jgi:signal transduction histidine kinase
VHDLRSPLQAIMGSMRLVDELVPDKDPVVQQATEVSGRALKKLLNLVNNLLDLSRLERGEFALDVSVESVPAILEEATTELSALAQEVDAVVKVEAPDDLPEAYIDRDMVERVVLNLLDNALKFTPPGEMVVLSASVRSAQAGQKDDMILVQIADKGPGVPDEFKEYVFERFSQVPGQKGRRRSAGLGLAFCQLAVESHGGKIWIEDNASGGSVFNFTLPISTQPPEAEDGQTPDDLAALRAAAQGQNGVAQPEAAGKADQPETAPPAKAKRRARSSKPDAPAGPPKGEEEQAAAN